MCCQRTILAAMCAKLQNRLHRSQKTCILYAYSKTLCAYCTGRKHIIGKTVTLHPTIPHIHVLWHDTSLLHLKFIYTAK